MKANTNIILVASAALAVILGSWFLVLEPGLRVATEKAEESLAQGIELFDANDYEGALEVLARVPDGDAHKARARYYEGSAHMMLKDFPAAAARLEEALVLDPEDTGTLYALGVAYYQLGNFKLAKGYFAAVLEINPLDDQAKGLMDIMAKMERKLSAVAESE
jgi:tetratricopeptide (TPR) repeat protein